MPNNFVFDTVAQDLRTLVYGANGANAVPLAVDAEGNLEIGVSYTSSNATITSPLAGTGTALTLDSSEKSLYSYYVKNTGNLSTITVKLQVSPTTESSFFIDDSSTPVLLGPSAASVIVPKYYLNYTRLYYTNNDATNTATFVAYYDARE